MSNIFEEKAKEIGYELSKEYTTFPSTLLDNLKIFQTSLAPEEGIYIHPIVMGKILSSVASNQVTDVYIHKG